MGNTPSTTSRRLIRLKATLKNEPPSRFFRWLKGNTFLDDYPPGKDPRHETERGPARMGT
jgi:hypothetical protein